MRDYKVGRPPIGIREEMKVRGTEINGLDEVAIAALTQVQRGEEKMG